MPSSIPSFDFPDPSPVGIVVFLGIILAIDYPMTLFVLYKLFQHRGHRFIAPRCPHTLAPYLLLHMISISIFVASFIMGKPMFCDVQDAMYLSVAVFSAHFNFNIPALVFQSDANAHKVALAQVCVPALSIFCYFLFLVFLLLFS